jgi:hypothetical protein
MRYYPQYRFDDFFKKRYYEGGIHLYQVHRMYEHIMKDKNNEFKFHALIHGIDVDKKSKRSLNEDLDDQQNKQDLPLFRDPSEYDHLSDEERERITRKMKSQHRRWAQNQDIIEG